MRGPVTLFKDAWTLFKGHPWLFMGIYVVPGILAVVYGFLIALTVSPGAGIAIKAVVIPFVIVLTVALVVISIISTVALIRAVSTPQGMTIASAYKFGLKYFWPYAWLALLTGLSVLAGLILLIIPGIIVAVWLAFSYFVLVMEGKRGVEAMKASREYVRGHWLQVAGRILALVAALAVVSAIAGGILGAFTPLGDEGREALSSILNIVLVPFSIAYMYLLYQDIRNIKTTSGAPSAVTAEIVSSDRDSGNMPSGTM